MADARSPRAGRVTIATRKALESLDLPESDLGVAEVLLTLARDIDNKGKVEGAPLDNVSVPTYLKFADALGMTPESRAKLAKTAAPAPKGSAAPKTAPVGDELGQKREARSWKTA